MWRLGPPCSPAWQQHTYAKFVLKNADATLATMTENPYVLLIPAGTGGTGRAAVREFYANHFLPNIPPDFELISLSQTFGNDPIVEEFVISFTHSLDMDWMLPGMPATGRRVEFAFVASSSFKTAKWPMSISIGIRPRCSPRWAFSIIPWRRPELAAPRNFGDFGEPYGAANVRDKSKAQAET